MTTRFPKASRAGFTLVELMVALTIGSLLVVVVLTLGGSASRHFREQQRIGQTQRAVRMAMGRVARDAERAGFGTVPDPRSPNVNLCPTPPLPRDLPAVWFDDSDSNGNAALDSVARSHNRVSADRVRFIGNFATSDSYLVRGMNEAGTVLFLQTDWLAFQRTFQSGGFDEVFRSGRMLHIETRSQQHIFVNIVSASLVADTASITITPGLGSGNPCIEGFGEGSYVSPISEIEYEVATAQPGSDLLPRDPAVTGQNTQLIRRELNMTDGSVLNRQAVLDFAVDFNLEFIIDAAPFGAAPNIVRQDGPTAEATILARPWQVRGVIASVTARTPEQDPRFPWPQDWSSGRPPNTVLNRYQVFTDRRGAARVRSLTSEVFLPNLLPR